MKDAKHDRQISDWPIVQDPETRRFGISGPHRARKDARPLLAYFGFVLVCVAAYVGWCFRT